MILKVIPEQYPEVIPGRCRGVNGRSDSGAGRSSAFRSILRVTGPTRGPGETRETTMTTTNSTITLTETCWHSDRGATRDKMTQRAYEHFRGGIFHISDDRESGADGGPAKITMEFRPGKALPDGFVPPDG